MKNYKLILLQIAFFSATIFITSSCMNKEVKDTKEVAVESNDAKFNKNSNEKDAQFLVNAAEINIEEISLGKLAQQKGTTSHVKELGKMMEDQHTKSMNELVALAKLKNITLPTSQTESGQDAYKKLSTKSGIDFDKQYADMMVTGHKDAIALFEKASDDSTDPAIKAMATNIIPALKTHLNHAIMCQKECEKL